MRISARPTLLAGLALAADAVGPDAGDVPAQDDPLRLDLPALQPAASDLPGRSTVRVFAALYLAAELEQAGVVPIAELLTEERYTLSLATYEAAAKLEEFAGHQHDWYDRAGRVQVYARLFGIGPAATNDAGAFVNREFVPLLASLCTALARYADATAGGATLDAGARLAASSLLANIGPRALGNTLLAARRLEDQVRRAVDLLRDPAIAGLVGARTLQQTIVNILGKDAPDVQRLIDSGLAGQKVIEWLADAAARLSGTGPFMSANDPIAVAAAMWLQAAGVAPPDLQKAA